MVRLLGAVLVVVSCGIWGLSVAWSYRLRPRELRAFISGLKLLETEIAYACTPLPQALEKIGGQLEGAVKMLFLQLARRLRDEPGLPATYAWEQGLNGLKEKSALLPQDLEILRALGQGLGLSGREDQVKNLELAREHLKRQLALAEEAAERQGRMWRTLGFLLGITLALLMY